MLSFRRILEVLKGSWGALEGVWRVLDGTMSYKTWEGRKEKRLKIAKNSGGCSSGGSGEYSAGRTEQND